MYPTLLKIGPVQIHAYGLLLAISFLVGIFWTMSRGGEARYKKDDVMDAGLITVVAAIIGSRLFYVVTHIEEFRGRWLDTISPIQSSGEIGIAGLSMLGGVVCALAAIALFCIVKKIRVLRFFDSAAPSLAFGLGLTRIGCFLNGCCFGKPGNQPWCMVFPDSSPASVFFYGIRIHPTQLYSSIYDFLMLGILLLVDRKRRVDGFLSALFFVLYGLFRFSIDFVRFYEDSVQFKLMGMAFTYNQLISLTMAAFGIVLMFLASRTKGGKE